MNPIYKNIGRASLLMAVLIAFQVKAQSTHHDPAAMKAAAEACAQELGIAVPPPPPHGRPPHGDNGNPPPPPPGQTKESMEKFHACMKSKLDAQSNEASE